MLLGACGSPPPAAPLRPGALRDGNVLLITIDTLRRDRIGAYGNPNGLTPTLDSLAADGLRYTNAHAHVPMTLPSHASILTGLTPRRTGVRNNTTFRLDDRIPTLATFLEARRLLERGGRRRLRARCALRPVARLRRPTTIRCRSRRDRRSTLRNGARRPSPPSPAAVKMPRSGPEPGHGRRFAWVHLFDPHTPYDAPPEFRTGRSPVRRGGRIHRRDARRDCSNRLRACAQPRRGR